MPKITKIEVQKNNKDRFNLYLDDEFEMGIDIDTFVYFNLKKGQIVEASDMEKIQNYEQYRQAINIAIQYLSYRKRTEHEVSQHLAKKDISESVIANVLDYCHKQNLIDHKDYANSLKNTMILTTDKGPEIFKQKLREAGIEQNIIDEYALLYDDEQSLDKIIKLANKILKQKKGPQIKRKEKLKQSLIQKGYTFETINIVMEELDFSQSEETLDMLLQDDLEKAYTKTSKKFTGKKLVNKTIETLMRKGYQYDKIKAKLEESGIEDGTEEIE
ncbi:recombination regulator RecX [Staphylococcus cohnii]|uniref:Regulatory protein RecX n=1 Tax=Staphylococcus cohnii subsp. cohnii TaxID=74704 RepID=A0A0M2NW25_STACC|nr:recombination regulator RecX [Staphylococcus cohnii]AYX90223.1 recombination regulator RecX [Staphylococcus cohnii]KKI64177.1 regulatory protein RecX [Staphylococcus cohnii subsp. cohnii]MDE1710321.1 recombination regulator RecX [Staphylococcus cohnii]OIS28763.1 RecX family transcriptional regulator [Staphylococcus cohnii]OIS33321.1 RecX family transcriptional regulator [Staphylococcus cohnii]